MFLQEKNSLSAPHLSAPSRRVSIYMPCFGSFRPLPYFDTAPVNGRGIFRRDKKTKELDLNRLLIKNANAIVLARMADDSMIGSGILSGDLLVVDRSIQEINDKIIAAIIGDDIVIKRYTFHPSGSVLHSDHPNFPPILISKERSFEILGVVTNVIRPL